MPYAIRPIRSRIAPTPSGYIHLGNAVNFLITWALVRISGGTLLLRIDDMDPGRTRPEYVEEIFRSLEWLGIDWDLGPEGPDDFYKNHSIQTRKAYYRDELAVLMQKTDRLYACSCSRKTIQSLRDDGLYPGTCRRLGKVLIPDESAMRVFVPEGTRITLDDHTVALDRTLGDFVIWRKDHTPAYQFASLIDDRDWQMDTVIRGDDLLGSTAAQLYLSGLLGITAFRAARFIHHPLMMHRGKRKLSKSEGDHSIRTMRDLGLDRSAVYERTIAFLEAWGGLPEAPALKEFLVSSK